MYYLDAFGQKNLGNNRIFVTEKLQISVWYDHFLSLRNKTGLQTVSRPVEQVHYFGGWVGGTKPFGAKALQTDNHTGLVGGLDA